MLKVNKKDRKMWRCVQSSVTCVYCNFEHVSHFFLVFLLLTFSSRVSSYYNLPVAHDHDLIVPSCVHCGIYHKISFSNTSSKAMLKNRGKQLLLAKYFNLESNNWNFPWKYFKEIQYEGWWRLVKHLVQKLIFVERADLDYHCHLTY